MFDFSSPLSFILACIVIELTPGPNMTYLAALSAMHGRKAGLSMVAGISLGLLIIGVAAAFGAAAIVAETPALYHLLRWAGVLYMCWLAWDTWRTPTDDARIETGFNPRHFRRGLITNLLNPKAALFYLTVFPRFIDDAQPALPQSLTMTIVYVGIATVIHVFIAVLGARARPLLNNPRHMRHVRRAFAFILLGIAFWLGWTTRTP